MGYAEAKAKDKNLDSYIKTRDKADKGSREYAVAQNAINKAYGVSKRYKVPASSDSYFKKTNQPVADHMKSKSSKEVKAYASNPDNFKGKTQYEAMGSSSKIVGKNTNITKLTGPIAKPGDVKDPGITSKADITGGQTPVNIAQKSTPSLKDEKASSSPSPRKPMRTSLGEGVGSGMAQMHTQMEGMATMASDMTGTGKGMFKGIKARRKAKKQQKTNPSEATLKQKSTIKPVLASLDGWQGEKYL